MAGTRQPTQIVQLKGAKHLTKAEIAKREAEEVKAQTATKVKVPKWLPKTMHAQFRSIAKQLIALDIYSDLDADTLGRYMIAQHEYIMATAMVETALAARDSEEANKAGTAQDRHFKQARACAADLGLTITSRCRLVIPEAAQRQKDEEAANPFLALMRRQA